ncbi:hypothetical protein BGLA2_220020 [Burkholderia gladioli]|nr:hypothetical protein BGLA2_220020 [Burkholderia gladioli]
MARPALRHDGVAYVVSHYGLTMRRACRLMKQPRSVQYYRSVKDLRPELRSRMREIAYPRVRYGYRRVHVLLRREAWQLGRNQACRCIARNNCRCVRDCRSTARWSCPGWRRSCRPNRTMPGAWISWLTNWLMVQNSIP